MTLRLAPDRTLRTVDAARCATAERHAPFAVVNACRSVSLALAAALVLGGCAVGPAYVTPTTPEPAAFKEAGDWLPAAPADTLARGSWWTLFGDPVLDTLVPRVEVSNQNVAAATAAYDQARALVREQRASLFPVVSLDAGATHAGGRGNARSGTSYQLSLGGAWEPDVWGRLRRVIENASAGAQASESDLAAARLAAQGELVANYVSLRSTDAQKALLATTVTGYERTLEIVQNRYAVGIVARTDVLQAQTQLANARADALTLERQRAQFEHAIAVLVGEAPATFTLQPATWMPTVPGVPVGLPTTLLQRRPDIAAAERRVAAANAQIGVAQSAYFPNFNLTGSYGLGASRLAELFSASSSAWSLGLAAAQTLFNAGATSARVAEARAGHAQAVARYRQTVLAAFQDVENQLVAARVLMQQESLRREASQAADAVETQVLNRYRAGQVSYTDVVTAQVTALNARRALVQLLSDRETAAVTLIQSLGGGWESGT